MKDRQEHVESAQVNEQLLSEVVALLESHQKWINKLPVPTTGATHQMMRVVGKAIDALNEMKAENAQKRQLQESEINDEWHAHGGKVTGNGTCFVIGKWDYHKLRRTIAAAEAQQADHIVDATKVVQQEPVAWRVHPFDYGVGVEGVYALTMRLDQVEAWKRKGWTVEPLYAQPQAVAAQPAPAYSEVQADAPAPATEYSWSHHGEEYHGVFSSVEAAVCDYLDTYGEDAAKTVHVGEVKPYKPENPIWLACQVLDMLGEQAHDEIGECAGDWPELPAEKREQMGKMIHDFVCKHDAPSFFSIRKSEMVEVSAYRDAAVQPAQGGEA